MSSTLLLLGGGGVLPLLINSDFTAQIEAKSLGKERGWLIPKSL